MGEHVYMQVKQKKSAFRLRTCAKLAPRFCLQLEILNGVALVAYLLVLPSHMKVNIVLHVSLLKMYLHDSFHLID